MSKLQISIPVLAMLATTAMLSVSPSKADSVAEFYSGKQLRIYVGFGAGGANDVWARILSRHMTNHIPGKPAAIVQSMPGAGSLRLTNYLYNVAPKDGTAFGIIARGVPFEGIFKGKGVEFDARKLSYIGSPAQEITTCAVTVSSPHKTIKDFFSQEVAVGTGGGGSETNLTPLTLRNVLGMKFKIVAGYKSGGTDVALALERNELQGICIGYATLSGLAISKRGGMRTIFKIALGPDETPDLKNVPNIIDSEMADDQRALLRLTFARAAMGRPFVGPPGIPAERLTALRRAFSTTMKDPGFITETKKAGLDIAASTGEELQAFVEKLFSTLTPEMAAKGAKALGR